jgi:prepilin signal peptidase PulO-like enzyme (type II secretory pathway)
MTLLIHATFGAILGAILARMVLKTDEQHRGLSFSLLTLSLIKMPGVSYWLYQAVLAFIMAGVFVLNALYLDSGWGLLYWQLISLLMLAAAVYDLAFRLIPVPVMALLIFFAAAIPLFFGFPLPYWDAFGGGLLVGGLVLIMYLITGGQGIGEADVLMALVIGLIFGWIKGLLVFSAANFLGLAVVIPLIFILGKKRMKQIPLVFFLVLAILLEWYVGYTGVVLGWVGVV